MKIKILKTHNTAIDCRTVVTFNEGEMVEVENEIADSLIKGKFAIEILEEKMLPKFENKAIFNAPENKEEEVIPAVEAEELTAIPENKEETLTKKKGKK